MATVLDMVTSSYEWIGVLADGETASADQAALGLRTLNTRLDSMATNRLAIYVINRTTWTITSGTGTYLVGPSQVINRARPVFIEHINFQDTSLSPTLECQLQPLTDDAYSQIPQKSLTAPQPTMAYYNPTFTAAAPYGTVILWPTPTSSTLQGVMYAPTAVTQFTAVTDTFLLPPGWQLMLETATALDLAPKFQRDPSPLLIKAALESMADVKRSNFRLSDLSVDPAALIQGGNLIYQYSILTGP